MVWARSARRYSARTKVTGATRKLTANEMGGCASVSHTELSLCCGVRRVGHIDRRFVRPELPNAAVLLNDRDVRMARRQAVTKSRARANGHGTY